MNTSRSIIILMIILLSLTACNAATSPVVTPSPMAETISLPPTQTLVTEQPAARTPVPTFTPTPSPEPTPTNTRVPTITPTPSPTLEPKPMVTISETVTTPINIRNGPGTNYPVIGQFEPGQMALVTGRDQDTRWWQVSLTNTKTYTQGWVYGALVTFSGSQEAIPIAIPPSPPPTPTPVAPESKDSNKSNDETPTPEELADKLHCDKDFCVTYQAMLPIWENGGCVGNHSIYITVLQGLPPGQPMDGVVVGDTFNNVEVASGSHGPGRTEITLWSNSMTLIVKRHIDDTPYTSQESFNFTARDELIPAEVLAANGYCGGNVVECEYARNHNSVCRGHYSWRVTFHKFN